MLLMIVGFSAVLFREFKLDQQKEFDAALYNYATDLSRAIDVTFFGTLTFEREIIWDRDKIFPFLVGQAFIQIIDTKGQVLARSGSLGNSQIPLFPEDLQGISRFQASFRTIDHPEFALESQKSIPHRLITYPIERNKRFDLVLQVAVSQILVEQQLKRLLTFFLVAIPLTLLPVIFGGYYLSGQVLAPVSEIIEKASKISASDLSQRVPEPLVDDELRDLSLTINQLLSRVQLAFESQERFVADASHQLRTPLAILKGELDVLRSRERSPQEIQEFFQSASQELQYLSRMVNDLLILARVDAGRDSLKFDSVRMDELLLEVSSRFEKLAQSKHIRMRLNLNSTGQTENDFEVQGDPDLLRTLIQNLVENAIKFSHPDQPILMSLESHVGTLSLQVTNYGPVISEEDQSRVFDRFYRSSQGMASVGGPAQPPGLGLGLTIVKRIIEAHQGQISVKSHATYGTTFTVELSTSAPSESQNQV